MIDNCYVCFCGNHHWAEVYNIKHCYRLLLDFSSLARWNEPADIQPKQTGLRTSHHHYPVNRVELLPLIFIRLQSPYLQTSLSSTSLYQSADSRSEQPVVIWQDWVWVSTWKLASRRDFRLICCTDSAGHMFVWARSDGEASLWKYWAAACALRGSQWCLCLFDSREWSRGRLPAYQGRV